MSKPKRVDDTSAGSQPYMDWHRDLDDDLFMVDVDSIEISPQGFPLAFLELKPIGDHIADEIPTAYLNALSTKYVGPKGIGRCFNHLAIAFPQSRFLIVCPDFRFADKRFHVFNMRYPHLGWKCFSEKEYVEGLRNLRRIER